MSALSTAEMFPENYNSTEVAESPITIDTIATHPEPSRDSQETDATIQTRQDNDPRRDAPAPTGRVEASEPVQRTLKKKASRLDRYMGHLEKTAGHYFNDPYLHAKGELRKTGILAARKEQKRAGNL